MTSRVSKQRSIQTMEERFWSKVNKEGPLPDGHVEYEELGRCWLFTSATLNYPRSHEIKRNKKIGAARYSYELHHEQIPDGMVVRHKCDNGHLHCVNPDHLELGTQQENMVDMARRRRIFRRSIDSKMLGAARVAYREFELPLELMATMMGVTTRLLAGAISDRARVCEEPAFRKHEPISDREVDLTVALIKEGKSLNKISAKLGRSWGSLSQALVDHGYDYEHIRKQSGGKINQTHAQEAHSLAEKGWSMNQISAHLGFSYGTISRALERHGLPSYKETRAQHRVTMTDIERALVMTRAGTSMNKIAAELGYGYGTIVRAMKKAGYDYYEVRAAAVSVDAEAK